MRAMIGNPVRHIATMGSMRHLGIDLGGTYIKAGVVDDDLTIVAQEKLPTPDDKTPDSIMDAMAELARLTAAAAGMELKALGGVGVGIPGPVNPKAGVVAFCVNLDGWLDTPVADMLGQRLSLPITPDNDANVAGFGEFTAMSRQRDGLRNLVMLTLGTGIGGAVISEGELVRGDGLAGEIGHMIVDPGGRRCSCGQRGCIEAYASAASVRRLVLEAMDAGARSSLAGHDRETLSARHVTEAVAAGDDLATRVFEHVTQLLGITCLNLDRVLDPQVIVIGGGLAEAGDALFDRVRGAYREQTWSFAPPALNIEPAQLGYDAGVIGAAALAATKKID